MRSSPARPWYYWQSVFRPAEIKKINKLITRNLVQMEDVPAAGVTKTSEVKMVHWGKIKSLLSPMYTQALCANEWGFGFNLYPIRDSSTLHYNIYSSTAKGQYDWHEDGITFENPVSDFKLTNLLNLSEAPYEGGSFYLGTKYSHVKELSVPGNMITFPSFRNHRVTPVTKGIRKTLTLWLVGAKFI